MLEKVSMRNFSKRIGLVYPTLPQTDIDQAVQDSFPDVSDAIERLRPVATYRSTITHLINKVNMAKQYLDNAHKRADDFQKTQDLILKIENYKHFS